jgi:hypothetical protein
VSGGAKEAQIQMEEEAGEEGEDAATSGCGMM